MGEQGESKGADMMNAVRMVYKAQPKKGTGKKFWKMLKNQYGYVNQVEWDGKRWIGTVATGQQIIKLSKEILQDYKYNF